MDVISSREPTKFAELIANEGSYFIRVFFRYQYIINFYLYFIDNFDFCYSE